MSRLIICLMLVTWVHCYKSKDGLIRLRSLVAAGKVARQSDSSPIPTLKTYTPFLPGRDAHRLKNAMSGWGTDEKAIINVLAKRTFAQRRKIEREFKKDFKYDFRDWLYSEISGWFYWTIRWMMEGRHAMLAEQLYYAMRGAGTNEKALINILVPCTEDDLKKVKKEFKKFTSYDLEDRVTGETSGSFNLLLRDLLHAKRPTSTEVDLELAKKDAEALFNDNDYNFNKDAILTRRSWRQLAKTFSEFKFVTGGKSFRKAVKDTTSGWFRVALLRIADFASDFYGAYANELNEATKYAGTDENALVRVIVGRAEIDLRSIEKRYKELYGKTVTQHVKGDTSGYFRSTLTKLLAEE